MFNSRRLRDMYDDHKRRRDIRGSQSISMERYQYEPLDSKKKEIRLMSLLAGSFDDPIHVVLHKAQFHADRAKHIPQFEALSYTWGCRESPVDITVGSKKSGTGSLAVSWNLAEALPYLRHRDKDRLLWIDAICVDQNHLDERSRQIRRMGDIYTHAAQVLVWLGPEKDGSAHALALLGSLSKKMTVDWELQKILPTSKMDPPWAEHEQPLPFNKFDWLAIFHLYSRPWFERLWVQQEIRLSKVALLICGHSTLAWESFRDAAWACYNNKKSRQHTLVLRKDWCRQANSRILDLVHNCHPGSANLNRWPNLLYETRDCKSTDSRDRVFAVLSLISIEEQAIWRFEPDYNKTVVQVYVEASSTYLQSVQSLDLLRYRSIEERQHGLDLPSWVLNCEALTALPDPLWQYYADAGAQGQFQLEGSRALLVQGLLVDFVTTSIQFRLDERSYTSDAAKDIQRVSLGIFNNEDLPQSLDLLSRVLLAGCIQQSFEPSRLDLPIQTEAQQLLKKLLRCTTDEIGSLKNESGYSRFFANAQSSCERRSLIILDSGELGLAPAATRPKDIVVVLPGCPNPLVLRPVNEASGSFQIVGECFVDSIMAGEKVIGPLPKNVELIQKLNDQTLGHNDAFRNNETGSMVELSEDPRYDLLLGEGWRERPEYRDFEGHAGSWFNKVAMDCMKVRGVKTQEFRIV